MMPEMAHTQGASVAQPSLPQAARPCPGSYTADDRLVQMMENWGLVVKRLRIVYGLSQQRVGIMFGVSQRTVSRWERSEAKPGPECRRRLRELEWDLSEALADNRRAPDRQSPFPAGLSAGPNRDEQAQAQSRNDDMLHADHMPAALADRVVTLLGCLSPKDIERLPAQGRRRLADQCRQIAQLAGSSEDDLTADLQRPPDATAPQRVGRREE